MVHMAIDNDEQVEKACDDCKSELDKNKCSVCGKEVQEKEANSTFDEEYFKKLKANS
jgi:rRNA maturation endonuclease Nob1